MADALLDELKTKFTIACPAFPENGRTIYLGHLFVGGDLLSDSSMRNHPLTPMKDANLVRVLARQSKHKTGLVPYKTVKAGAPAIAEAFAMLEQQGVRHAIVDALEDKDLENIGAASSGPASSSPLTLPPLLPLYFPLFPSSFHIIPFFLLSPLLLSPFLSRFFLPPSLPLLLFFQAPPSPFSPLTMTLECATIITNSRPLLALFIASLFLPPVAPLFSFTYFMNHNV